MRGVTETETERSRDEAEQRRSRAETEKSRDGEEQRRRRVETEKSRDGEEQRRSRAETEKSRDGEETRQREKRNRAEQRQRQTQRQKLAEFHAMNVIMREPELAGEERSYIGSAQSARRNDCHARAKGVDRGARCTPLTPLTRQLTRTVAQGARVSKAAYAAHW